MNDKGLQIERNMGRDWDRGFKLIFGVFILPDGRSYEDL